MKAGMEFMTNEDRKQTPPKPKGRRGMPLIDPKKGIAVSADAAKALIAKGAVDARPGKDISTLKISTSESIPLVAPSTGVVAGNQTAFYPSGGNPVTSAPMVCRLLIQAINISDILQFQQGEDTISAPNSAVSGPSSPTPDDPKDTSYGQKGQRQLGAARTTASRKSASTAGKKRKSTEGLPPAKKRTRHSADGTADDEH